MEDGGRKTKQQVLRCCPGGAGGYVAGRVQPLNTSTTTAVFCFVLFMLLSVFAFYFALEGEREKEREGGGERERERPRVSAEAGRGRGGGGCTRSERSGRYHPGSALFLVRTLAGQDLQLDFLAVLRAGGRTSILLLY